jgi:hypothetical protein
MTTKTTTLPTTGVGGLLGSGLRLLHRPREREGAAQGGRGYGRGVHEHGEGMTACSPPCILGVWTAIRQDCNLTEGYSSQMLC